MIALDIATAEMQGLQTADWFLETGDVYFERLLSVMYDPALASDSVDYVFCCEVLHHNDRADLRRTLARAVPRARPGGTLFMVNEPMRFPLRLKRDHAEEVAEFEGNEHVHFFHQYYCAARAAGFEVAGPGRARACWPAGWRARWLRATLARRAGQLREAASRPGGAWPYGGATGRPRWLARSAGA